MSHLNPFEFQLYKKLEPLKLEGRRILVACSGGMDSVALVYALARMASRLKYVLQVATVHHGFSKDEKMVQYRRRAVEEVKALADRLGLPFYLCARDKSLSELESEAELREFRIHALKEMALENDCAFIAFAHHADDLLETRLIRLVRGTGTQGLVAMRLRGSQGSLRPFLGEEKREIEKYARESGLTWVEDPSNQSRGPLRNWLREEWLPLLERKRQGSMRNLSLSLERLAESCGGEKAEIRMPLLSATLDCRALFELGISEQRASVAALLLSLGAKDFTSQHVEEVLKRLRSKKGRQEFALLGLQWQCNAGQIDVRRHS